MLATGSTKAGEISWAFLIFGLLGGLALFLYGMEKMSEGMKKSAGNKMRSILAALTKNRVIGLLVGAFVTMVIQSSSATTVMLVSFVQAELMSFAQSLGVILGADIGTTITAQLIAFKLTDYALLMIAVGFGLRMFAKHAMKPLRSYPGFINLMHGLENPLLGLLAGTMFTALIQSSSAFTGVLIVLAQQQLITLEAGIPMLFGANIGTCVTAGLASIGMSREAKRVALAHVVFKIAGVLLFIFWIPSFADIIRSLAAQFGADIARQIANAHTIFNVSLGLVFLPFTVIFANLILRLFPDKVEEKDLKPATWHLEDSSISTPAIAIDLARSEISRMAKILGRMLRAIIIPFMSDPNLIRKQGLPKEETNLLLEEIPTRDEIYPQLTLLEGLDMREEKIDFLEEKVGDYLIQIGRQELSDSETNEVFGMTSIVNDMESIGDIIHRIMIPLIDKKQALAMDFSEEGKEELLIFHVKICKQISRLKDIFAETDPQKALKIMAKEEEYLDLESRYRSRHLQRFLQQRKETAETHEVHMELLDLLKQINVYTGNIAKTILNSIPHN
jgi:phosphate:Na+ symporter